MRARQVVSGIWVPAERGHVHLPPAEGATLLTNRPSGGAPGGERQPAGRLHPEPGWAASPQARPALAAPAECSLGPRAPAGSEGSGLTRLLRSVGQQGARPARGPPPCQGLPRFWASRLSSSGFVRPLEVIFLAGPLGLGPGTCSVPSTGDSAGTEQTKLLPP